MPPSITSWSRLEPRTRVADLEPGLAARLADPLWLLARQWQLAEFRGEDAGSPASVRIRAHADRFTRFRRPGAEPVDLAPATPLETYVERETDDAVTDLRLAVESGRQAVLGLRAAGLTALARHLAGAFRLHAAAGRPHDDATAAALRTLTGRVPHGLDLRAAVLAADGVPPGSPVHGDDKVRADGVLRAWARARHPFSTGTDAEDCWQPHRFEHGFAIAAAGPAGETVLVADGYPGDRLDWPDLDVDPAGSLGAVPGEETTERLVRTVLPAPAGYPGMPSPRWWEMEPARVSFGRIEAGRTDLAGLLLVEYASLFANDHFVVPIDLPVGTVTRIDSVVVTTTFGERIVVPPAPSPGGWSLFRPSRRGETATEPVLVLLPTVPEALHGRPVEQVLMLRDEMANLVWGVEVAVPSPMMRPVDRHEQEARAVASPPPPAAGDHLVYQVRTPVPAHWIPFVPVEKAPGAVELRRTLQQRTGPGGAVEPVPPLGRLLAPGADPFDVAEEEVPRAGIAVVRHWQACRWIDGSTHVWLGRHRTAGRGPGSAGLRFDVASERSGARVAGPPPNLLTNPDFATPSGTGATRLEGTPAGGPSAAAGWSVWNNADTVTTTELLPSDRPDSTGGMVHVRTGGPACGLVQAFLDVGTGPAVAVASAWVRVVRGRVQLGTGNGGATGGDVLSAEHDRWQVLTAPNGNTPANELIIYSHGAGPSEFFVEQVSLRAAAPS